MVASIGGGAPSTGAAIRQSYSYSPKRPARSGVCCKVSNSLRGLAEGITRSSPGHNPPSTLKTNTETGSPLGVNAAPLPTMTDTMPYPGPLVLSA